MSHPGKFPAPPCVDSPYSIRIVCLKRLKVLHLWLWRADPILEDNYTDLNCAVTGLRVAKSAYSADVRVCDDSFQRG